jgi:hypothetical protein
MPRFKRTPSLPCSIPESTAFWKEKKRITIEVKGEREDEKRKKERREAGNCKARRGSAHSTSLSRCLSFDPPKRR